tara:strand:+ start:111 stop:428 length:318 start_codon:yes stop_codon:yes gene_type:complete
MKIIKSLSIFCIFIVGLNSCGTFKEAGKVLRNEKSQTTDEFLIKKKDPLTQPPDFNIIPKPGTTASKSNKSKNNIERIIKGSQSQSSNSQTKASSTENSILKQIK